MQDICAVVVTHNRKHLLAGCLRSLQSQTVRPRRILVVDNASNDGTTQDLSTHFPDVEFVRLETNIGGAGGFYTGMKVARDDGAEWIWIMDDDALPSPIALEELLRHAKPNRVLVPLQQDETGRLHGIGEWSGRYVDRTAEVLGREAVVGKYVFAFVGPLFSRSVINIIGLPECEFFIWFDDIEYALRLQSSDAVEITVIPAAVIRHPSLTNATVAPWKIYYGARNSTHVAIHRSRGYKPLIRLATFQLYALLHDLLFGPQRLCRAEMRMRGLVDGVFGRLGYRVNAVA